MNKPNLVCPLAGKGSRFVSKGITIPKFMIHIDHQTIIEKTLSCIDYEKFNLIFILRQEHIANYHADQFLKQKFGNDIKIISVNKDTEGSVCSVLLAEEFINNNSPLLVHCSDIYCEPKVDFFGLSDNFKEIVGIIPTFKANSPNYSYVQNSPEIPRKIIKTAEKLVISNDAAVGLYWFKSGKLFVKYAKKMIKKNLRTNNEFYLTPLYNLLIEDGHYISNVPVDKMLVFGTPEELDYTKMVMNGKFGSGKIGIACDHSGYEGKEYLKRILKFHNLDFIDYGCYSEESCDYVDYSKLVVDAIINKEIKHGFLLCKSGNGMQIYANKFKDVRCALIFNRWTAEYSIKHNAANVWSIPTNEVDRTMMENMVSELLKAEPESGRHQTRIMKTMGLI